MLPRRMKSDPSRVPLDTSWVMGGYFDAPHFPTQLSGSLKEGAPPAALQHAVGWPLLGLTLFCFALMAPLGRLVIIPPDARFLTSVLLTAWRTTAATALLLPCAHGAPSRTVLCLKGFRPFPPSNAALCKGIGPRVLDCPPATSFEQRELWTICHFQ